LRPTGDNPAHGRPGSPLAKVTEAVSIAPSALSFQIKELMNTGLVHTGA
jgi:hypothetical protein